MCQDILCGPCWIQSQKDFPYQFIGGSYIVVLGIHVVDANLFVLSGIAKDVWRVT